jgi:nitric oxide reductase NorE protein
MIQDHLTAYPVSIKTPHQVKKLPGDIAMWFFILMELTVFAIFFIGFAVTKNLNPILFQQGQATLHPLVGLLCTLSLITSSYFVALAMSNIKQNNQRAAKQALWLSLLVASIYLVAKIWEYIQLGQAGMGLSSNTFYTLYFFITFFHFMHVLLGMVILIYMARQTGKNVYTESNHDGFEAGTCYWHMVDLVWVILFPIIYVIH